MFVNRDKTVLPNVEPGLDIRSQPFGLFRFPVEGVEHHMCRVTAARKSEIVTLMGEPAPPYLLIRMRRFAAVSVHALMRELGAAWHVMGQIQELAVAVGHRIPISALRVAS